MLSDEALGKSLIAEAHEHLRSFDWQEVAEQTAAAYRRLLDQAPRNVS